MSQNHSSHRGHDTHNTLQREITKELAGGIIKSTCRRLIEHNLATSSPDQNLRKAFELFDDQIILLRASKVKSPLIVQSICAHQSAKTLSKSLSDKNINLTTQALAKLAGPEVFTEAPNRSFSLQEGAQEGRERVRVWKNRIKKADDNIKGAMKINTKQRERNIMLVKKARDQRKQLVKEKVDEDRVDKLLLRRVGLRKDLLGESFTEMLARQCISKRETKTCMSEESWRIGMEEIEKLAW